MMLLLPDNSIYSEEDSKIYWRSIEELIEDIEVLSIYDTLHLHRLKKFMKFQIASREFQVISYLIEITKRDTLINSEPLIKEKLKGIKLKSNIYYGSYLNRFDKLKVKEVVEYVLKSAQAYLCSQKTLIYLTDLVQDEIKNRLNVNQNHNTSKEDLSDFFHPIFETYQSMLFFEFLIREWFNNKPKPNSELSFICDLMIRNNNELPKRYRSLNYKMKNIRKLEPFTSSTRPTSLQTIFI